MAFDGNLPVATGVLYIEGRCGYLAWGATMSTHRRRGGQAALIAERVRRARQLGLKCVTAETFGPAPGRPAISYRNFIRNGFEEAYRRPIFVWEQAR
jgi:GNAT superfamily N-acetyltransferase